MAAPQIEGYELLEPLGTGACTVIYRARDLQENRVVAVKYLCVEEKDDYKYLRHMSNEYDILAKVHAARNGKGPVNIVKAFRLIKPGLLRKRKESCLVLEYLEGQDLRRERRYPTGQMLDILTQMARAIQAIHACGFIHGDLKPENVIVSHEGHATLVDFGFACPSGTLANSIRGTRDYIAPEQVEKGFLTPATDIYNFGATMYFLLTGKHVPAIMPAQNDSAHFIAHVETTVEPPAAINPRIPPRLDKLILRCIERDIKDRPSRMDDVIAVLEDQAANYS